MLLEEAEKLAEEFICEIADYCEKVRIVGSIRRRRPQVKDIDVVLIVKDWFNFTIKLQQISRIKIDGAEVKRVLYMGEQFDLYLADHKTYESLILIRTGSAQHNIKLSMVAQKKGMKLSHKGLIKDGKVIASSEKEIFEALDLSYVPPEERE